MLELKVLLQASGLEVGASVIFREIANTKESRVTSSITMARADTYMGSVLRT